MARTRTLVESDLTKAQQHVKEFEGKLGSKPDKKTLRLNPSWRRLQASVAKYKNQLMFIDKRNKKPEPVVKS